MFLQQPQMLRKLLQKWPQRLNPQLNHLSIRPKNKLPSNLSQLPIWRRPRDFLMRLKKKKNKVSHSVLLSKTKRQRKTQSKPLSLMKRNTTMILTLRTTSKKTCLIQSESRLENLMAKVVVEACTNPVAESEFLNRWESTHQLIRWLWMSTTTWKLLKDRTEF